MYLRRNITVDSEHMPSLRDSRPVGHVVPRVAVAIATLPVAIECRRVATHMSSRCDSNAVASRFKCHCFATRMSLLRIAIVAKQRHSIAWGGVSDSERNPRKLARDPTSRGATASVPIAIRHKRRNSHRLIGCVIMANITRSNHSKKSI